VLGTVVSEIIGQYTIFGPGSLKTDRLGWNDYKTFYNPHWINRVTTPRKCKKAIAVK